MVVFGNHKYACLSCIRGHRSSSCVHRDRILLRVRKPGRKSQSESQSRYALVAKETSPSLDTSSRDNFRLVKVPDVAKLADEKCIESTEFEQADDDDVVVTDKYVFIHVGDNMFRRALRQEYIVPTRRSSQSSRNNVEISPNSSQKVSLSPVPSGGHSKASVVKTNSPEINDIGLEGHAFTPRHASRQADDIGSALHGEVHNSVHNGVHSNVHNGIHGTASTVSNGAHHIDIQQPSSHATHSHGGQRIHDHHAHVQQLDMPPASPLAQDFNSMLLNEAPLIIGPMQYQQDVQNRQANILNELGISAEEATEIWSGEVDGTDFSFASQCVLPGQCQCGDACECPDCYEHRVLKRRKMAMDAV